MTMTEDEVFNAINTSKIVRQSGQEFFMSVDDNGYGEIRTVPSFFDNYADAQMKKSEAIEGAVKKAGDVITSTPEFIYGGIKAAPVGLAKFGGEMMNTVFPYYNDNVVPWLENNLPGYNEMNEYLNDVLSPKSKVQEYGAMIGEPLGQLVVPGAGLSKGLKVYGFGNKFLRNVLGYGTAEVIGMTPDEEGLLELGTMLFVKNEMLRDAIFESLSANEDLPYLMQKIQKAPQRFLEGGLIGEGLDKALESVGVLYNGIKNSPELKSSLEKIGTDAQARLDQGGATVSSLGVGEIDTAIDTQLSKLAPSKNVDNLNFYSNALDQAKLIKQEKGTGEQFRNMLKNSGVKKDEIEWTGLDEILKKDKVTKQEVIEQLENNRIALQENVRDVSYEESQMNFNDDPSISVGLNMASPEQIEKLKANDTVMLAEDAYGPNHLEGRANEMIEDGHLEEITNIETQEQRNNFEKNKKKIALEEAEAEYYDNPIRIYQDSNTGYVITGNDDLGYQIFKNIEDTKGEGAFKKALNYGTPDDDPRRIGQAEPDVVYNLEEAKVQALRYAEDNEDIQFGTNITKFENETLPGGKNYREFTIVLADENNSAKLADVNYDASHWEESDVLAHIRTKDRIAEDGGKVLYIEEIQSDWGQQGKDYGFKLSNDEYIKVEKQRDALIKDHQNEINKYTILQQGKQIPFADWFYKRREEMNPNFDSTITDYIRLQQAFKEQLVAGFVYKDGKDVRISTRAIEEGYGGNVDEITQLFEKTNQVSAQLSKRTPKAPFVTDTKKWTALALKRILARAVDEGYDYVSITPGQVHAERWNREGNKEYYDVIIPSVAKDVLKSTDKGAISKITLARGLVSNKKILNESFTIKITPKVKEKVSAGQAMFAVPLAVGGMSALNQGDQDG
tara:strand:- start:4804 stop:7506 length:2703 start_codon:yes stop_codon:yes gene_type:complete